MVSDAFFAFGNISLNVRLSKMSATNNMSNPFGMRFVYVLKCLCANANVSSLLCIDINITTPPQSNLGMVIVIFVTLGCKRSTSLLSFNSARLCLDCDLLFHNLMNGS